jgi:hypothetical protein
MQQPEEPTPTALDEAVDRSERSWDKAEEAVEDLKRLGHEDDTDDDVENP